MVPGRVPEPGICVSAYVDGLTSTAAYLAWACSIHATIAREHVRVARALRTMPQTKQLFQQGRLSYSKVREVTRLVNVVDEKELCDLAVELTASQLARTVSTYRLNAGTRIRVPALSVAAALRRPATAR